MLLYFAYGSNMSSPRLRSRVAAARPLGPARLREYAWRCNKRGHDGTAKANLAPEPGGSTWGVVFAIQTADWDTLDRAEGGYQRVTVEVELDGEPKKAVTYASDLLADDLTASQEYRALMLAGAREHRLPDEWVTMLERLPVR